MPLRSFSGRRSSLGLGGARHRCPREASRRPRTRQTRVSGAGTTSASGRALPRLPSPAAPSRISLRRCCRPRHLLLLLEHAAFVASVRAPLLDERRYPVVARPGSVDACRAACSQSLRAAGDGRRERTLPGRRRPSRRYRGAVAALSGRDEAPVRGSPPDVDERQTKSAPRAMPAPGRRPTAGKLLATRRRERGSAPSSLAASSTGRYSLDDSNTGASTILTSAESRPCLNRAVGRSSTSRAASASYRPRRPR